MRFRLEFGSNEKLSAMFFQDWLLAHPQIAKEIEVMIYGESDGDHADIKAFYCHPAKDFGGQEEGSYLLWVGENKVDADAKKSRNDRHYHNNLAKLRDDYRCPKYVFLIDTGKMETYQHPQTHKWHRQAVFDKPLIGNMMHSAITIGNCIPYYTKKDHFGDLIWHLLQTPQKEVDCGIRYLERAPGTKWEQALQAFDGVSPKNAFQIAERYPTLVQLVIENCKISDGEIRFDPDWMELDDVFPPTRENEESAAREKFIKQIGGN